MQARRGKLFDPDQFPFMEGRAVGRCAAGHRDFQDFKMALTMIPRAPRDAYQHIAELACPAGTSVTATTACIVAPGDWISRSDAGVS